MDTKKSWRDMDTKDFPEIVYIEWWDALSDCGWEDDVEPNIHPVLSVGFIVSEDKAAICIAAAISDGQSNSRLHIPKGWITKIKRVRLNKFLDIRKKKSKPKVQKPKVENSSNGLETSSSTPFIFPKTM
mgnify:FL=1|jgi:hypothetical protein